MLFIVTCINMHFHDIEVKKTCFLNIDYVLTGYNLPNHSWALLDHWNYLQNLIVEYLKQD